MCHHIHTTTTVRTPSSFLLVLLINQHTINHHTLATLHQDTNTHLSMFPTMDTHHLTVHITPASHHTSTLDLEYKDHVTKVTTFVTLQLWFLHTKLWRKPRNALCTVVVSLH